MIINPCVENAISWIKKYQVFERNLEIEWKGKGIKKYGGCLKSVPCFIGIAKTVKALIYYNIATKEKDKDIRELILKGTNYIIYTSVCQIKNLLIIRY